MKASELLTRAEISGLTEASDLRGALAIVRSSALIAASLAALAVPWFRLPQLHRMLGDRGSLAHAVLSPGYLDVIRPLASGQRGI